MRRLSVAVVVWLSIAGLQACATASGPRGKIAGLTSLMEDAEKRGARTCAPRELALARANLEFASVELDQGERWSALDLIAEAAKNANEVTERISHASCGLQPRDVVTPSQGDRDGDGIADTVDKCPDDPETYNAFEDEDGCPDSPDSDNDGIVDSKDACMLLPEDMDGYLDEDGCPEPDNDSDGILDTLDRCPMLPEDIDGFEDSDGCPDNDNDGDTIPDLDDECPNIPGDAAAERRGCPKKDALVVVTAKELRITQQIQFESAKAIIRGAISFKILDEVTKVLLEHPKFTIEVQGHTDNVGNASYNRKLSQSRAEAVRTYLVAHGIDPTKLVARGYGSNLPLLPNSNDKNRSLNRRVQFIRTESTNSDGASPQGP